MMNAELLNKLASTESIVDFLDSLAAEFDGVDEDVVDLLHKACDSLDLVLNRKEELAEKDAKSHLPADFLAKLRTMSVNCDKMVTAAEQMRDAANNIEYAEELSDVFDDLYNAANAAQVVANEYLALNDHPQEQNDANYECLHTASMKDLIDALMATMGR